MSKLMMVWSLCAIHMRVWRVNFSRMARCIRIGWGTYICRGVACASPSRLVGGRGRGQFSTYVSTYYSIFLLVIIARVRCLLTLLLLQLPIPHRYPIPRQRMNQSINQSINQSFWQRRLERLHLCDHTELRWLDTNLFCLYNDNYSFNRIEALCLTHVSSSSTSIANTSLQLYF